MIYTVITFQPYFLQITTRDASVVIPVKPDTKYTFSMLTKNSKGVGEFAPLVEYKSAYFGKHYRLLSEMAKT